MSTTKQQPARTAKRTRPPRPHIRRAPRGARVDPTRVVLLSATLLVAVGGLHPLLQGLGWFFAVASLMLVPIIVATLARAIGVPPGVAPLLALLASGLALAAGFAPGTTILGVIPTEETWRELALLPGAGLASIAAQRVPAEADAGIVFVLALLGIGVAIVTEAVALGLRRPAFTVVPVVGILAIPVIVSAGLADPVAFVLAGIGSLALLRLPTPRSTVLATATLGTTALIAAFVVPPVALAEAGSRGSVVEYATGINPLVSLGRDLRRADPVEAVTYWTDNGSGAYLRLTALPVFSGENWTAGDVSATVEDITGPLPCPVGQADEVSTVERSGTFSVGAISSRWVPVPYPATEIEGLEGAWQVETDGLSIRTSSNNAYLQSYDLSYLDVSATSSQLRAATDPGPELARELTLPDEVPANIVELAREATADAATDYDAAVALQNFLRGPTFEYSTETPLERDGDGASLDVVSAFLDQRSGYCVHFASTMAIMARTLGIPSRLVVGFQPGTETLITLEDGRERPAYVVTTHDLHAWPELYFEGVGWTRFEPTPSRGSVPNYPEALPGDAVTVPGGGPTTPRDSDEVTRPSLDPRDDEVDADGVPLDGAEEGLAALPAVTAAVLAVLLAAALTPMTWRALRRRRRLRRIRRREGAAQAAWDEIRDTARDVGWSAPDSETPRAFAARLGIVVSAQRELLDRVRDDVERTAFSADPTAVLDERAVIEVRRAILASADWRARVTAIVAPPSLLPGMAESEPDPLQEPVRRLSP